MQFENALLRQCWFLAGPTACGKSAAGVCLARRLDAEIVALDSMSVYRGMNIGTAKPTAAEQREIPHHLIDILDPGEEYSVAQYLAAAERACREIVARGRIPLFVGGTGLYLRSLLRGVFEGPPADWDFRRGIESEAEGGPPDALHRRLQAVDPASAARLHPRDTRRMIRALEVHHRTGRPASELQRQPPLREQDRPRHVYWLHPPRRWLYQCINQRVVRMVEHGFVAEVEALLAGPPLSRTARQAVGYRELIEHLEGGCTLPAAIAAIQTRSRQFAKRQHTWFQNLVECNPLTMTGRESAEELAGLILAAAGGG